ncbi:hypothetical protein [Terasakiella sp.]
MADITLWQVLSGGGDLATIGFVLLLWKIDRRLFAVEIELKGVKQNVGKA